MAIDRGIDVQEAPFVGSPEFYMGMFGADIERAETPLQEEISRRNLMLAAAAYVLEWKKPLITEGAERYKRALPDRANDRHNDLTDMEWIELASRAARNVGPRASCEPRVLLSQLSLGEVVYKDLQPRT